MPLLAELLIFLLITGTLALVAALILRNTPGASPFERVVWAAWGVVVLLWLIVHYSQIYAALSSVH